MIRRELLVCASRENLERLAKWMKLTINPDWSDAELINKIYLEIRYS